MPKVASLVALALAAGCAACGRGFAIGFGTDRDVVLLTSDRCAAAAAVRTNLDEALRRLNMSTPYAVVDVDTLPDADPRVTYGAPTVIVRGTDLFGRVQPPAPPRRAECRSFDAAGGAAWPPSAEEIARRLAAVP